MKSLRKVCAVAVLACAFAVPVCAGDIHTPTVTAPPPPPAQATGEATEGTGDVLSEVIASLLSGLLGVL